MMIKAPADYCVEKEKRGFALLSVERRKEIASKGGKMAHLRGTAHEWDVAAARDAGRKGGSAKKKAVA
jgi:general stress protein YciG